MEEAERLCDRVAVMDLGRIVALDTPRALINDLGAEATVTFTVDTDLPADLFCELDGVQSCRLQEPGYAIVALDAQRAVVSLLELAKREGLRVGNLDVQGANLEDVFLSMTGHKLGDDDATAEEAVVEPKKRRRLRARGR